MMRRLPIAFAAATCLVFQSAVAVRNLRIVSPLQALTIWDPEAKEEEGAAPATHRGRFLPRFRAGLEAEAVARRRIGLERKRILQADATSASKDWADRAERADARLRESAARAVEESFDEAMKKFESASSSERKAKGKSKSANEYQFVGVVNSRSSGAPITWYARKKPLTGGASNWSVRLVHVNRRAIVKDLFNRGKVDVFARYENTGNADPERDNQPIVTGKYTVRERSWK